MIINLTKYLQQAVGLAVVLGCSQWVGLIGVHASYPQIKMSYKVKIIF